MAAFPFGVRTSEPLLPPAPARPHRVHIAEPYADGILFDELYGASKEARQLLIGRGLVWLTSFRIGDRHFWGNVVAASWEEAEKIADARGLGEEVIGQSLGEGQW